MAETEVTHWRKMPIEIEAVQFTGRNHRAVCLHFGGESGAASTAGTCPALLYISVSNRVSRIATNTVVQNASGMKAATESSCSSNLAGSAPVSSRARAELRS